MQFIVEDAESHLNITVTEPRIDAAIATLFKDKLREIVVKNRKPVHMDMAAVDFMDSSGLGAMIAVRKSLPENLALAMVIGVGFVLRAAMGKQDVTSIRYKSLAHNAQAEPQP